MKIYLYTIMCCSLLKFLDMAPTQSVWPRYLSTLIHNVNAALLIWELPQWTEPSITESVNIFSELWAHEPLLPSGSVYLSLRLNNRGHWSLHRVYLKTVMKVGVGTSHTGLHDGLSASQPIYSKKLQKYTSYNFTPGKYAGWHWQRKMLLMLASVRFSLCLAN